MSGRTFHAMFAGSVSAVLAGIVGGALVAMVAASLWPAAAGAAAGLGGLAAAVLATPLVIGRVMGAGAARHVVTAYAFALIAVVFLVTMTYLYVPMVQAFPTVIAASAVAGIRYSQLLD